MSAEFRQRTPGEYANLFWRRKWMIILPALAMASAIAVVVWRLPNIYESTALLIVQPPTIPNAVLPATTDSGALSSRLDSMTQQVQSRSSLEPMITKYNLYEKERQDRSGKVEQAAQARKGRAPTGCEGRKTRFRDGLQSD